MKINESIISNKEKIVFKKKAKKINFYITLKILLVISILLAMIIILKINFNPFKELSIQKVNRKLESNYSNRMFNIGGDITFFITIIVIFLVV